MKSLLECYLLMFVLLVLAMLDDKCTGNTCPLSCICKWKGGKQTVECKDRGMITLPEGVDSETQVLDVSGNNFQILPREKFISVGLINLQRIFLLNCRIGKINEAAFKGLTNLIELDLSHNLLTSIPSDTFQYIPSLRDLVLANNPIQKIDPKAFKYIPGLIKLDLSHCEIQMIAPNAFEGIELLESLKLNGNRLSELRPRTIETLRHLHAVELQDNPWNCDCRLRPVKEWLTLNNIPIIVAPVCSGGPERVIQSKFTDLHFDDFACKPDMLPVNRDVDVNTNDNITLVCRASAVPAPHISWYWNGRLLVNNSAFSPNQKIFIFEEGNYEKRSTFLLTNAQESNSNDFYCVAENRAGSGETNFTVHVSLHAASMIIFGNSHIAGLSAILVAIILIVLMVILVLLVRVKNQQFSESKTPNSVETVVNSSISSGKTTVSLTAARCNQATSESRKVPSDLSFCNPIQKPPRLTDFPNSPSQYAVNGSIFNSASCFVSPSSGSGNNPDLINDTRLLENVIDISTSTEQTYEIETLERPGSGDYSRNSESLYPSGLWSGSNDSAAGENLTADGAFTYNVRMPIINEKVNAGADYNFSEVTPDYPPDYGLPIPENNSGGLTSASNINLPTNAKTLRVWQKGAVPVLPPVTAIKRALTQSRNSPDEGYQEGCGTDV
ncbi:leucine-rich repeat-containing protein 24 [Agrilus planipennis]|uniref:Leucine-rich repeat-containing protein 24 n=1 Tax=Agrilus planipennis TaxID=224129 RepID=A0A1W4WR46_AGRPL|nr:leucine-rich repeat-containing protein 24 [Agrilus planipennis]